MYEMIYWVLVGLFSTMGVHLCLLERGSSTFLSALEFYFLGTCAGFLTFILYLWLIIDSNEN